MYLDDSDDNNDGNKYNDPNDLTSAGSNEGFNPIGSGFPNYSFRSSYNGNNYSISGLTINRPDQDYVGFICEANNGPSAFKTLTNIYLEDAVITGKNNCGILAGALSCRHITNCRANGTISGNSNIGLLAGQTDSNSTITITNCSSPGTFKGFTYI